MSKIYNVETNEFIENLATELKNVKEVESPEWAKFAKTGVHKERPPVRDDWWHVRVAAVLRSVFKLGPIGTSKLRVKYGGRKNRGVKPEHTYKGSGSIIRKSLQQLEKAGLVKQVEKGKHKGRMVSEKGKALLNKIADIKPVVKKEVPKPSVEVKKPEVKVEPKVQVKTEVKKEVSKSSVEVKKPEVKVEPKVQVKTEVKKEE